MLMSLTEAAGAFAYGKLHAVSGANDKGRSPSDVMDDLELHACPGAGACGGMGEAFPAVNCCCLSGNREPGSCLKRRQDEQRSH